ncbi:hypothetical protein GPECTOR_11g99 [Gonium pectorale]|uniref:EF-hand domain-containing protein n=1 Tax=Gonium pectorale TaxID=33097 RepID=A0A150GQ67_GONPE|nr:hypothetical protein GPECTOR_11g99 [Gonium pectorale]|eukprot:KXZ51977.1 hypothetical protein GPECTOR_11g99 [Gonium pectorale]
MSRTGSGGGSRKREELAAQFIAEFPADDDPDEGPPEYAEGSREATLLKIFNLLDSDHRNFIEIPVWKEYAVQVGLTTEALGKEVMAIVAAQSSDARGDPRVNAYQFVKAMTNMVAHMDDKAFGMLLAQTLTMYRARGGSHNYSKEQEQERPTAAPAMSSAAQPVQAAQPAARPVQRVQPEEEGEAVEALQPLQQERDDRDGDEYSIQPMEQGRQARQQRNESDGIEILDA